MNSEIVIISVGEVKVIYKVGASLLKAAYTYTSGVVAS